MANAADAFAWHSHEPSHTDSARSRDLAAEDASSFGSTRESSSFVSHPELLHSQQFGASADHQDLSMDDSIAGLRKSLDRLKIVSPSSKNDKKYNKSASFADQNGSDDAPGASHADLSVDTTRYNETLAQLDRGFDPESAAENLSVIAKSRTVSSTPWRHLRSASSFRPPDKVSVASFVPPLAGFDQTDATKRINELNQQLTGYRIQIRLFKQFLQKLIDSGSVASDDELLKLSVSLEKDKSRHSQNYEELFQLNQDLYDHLSLIETQLHQKEASLQAATGLLETLKVSVDEMLTILINDSATDPKSRAALSRCQAQKDMAIEMKLQVVKMELSKRCESRRASFASSTTTNVDNRNECGSYVSTVEQLMGVTDQLKNDYSHQKQINLRISDELEKEINVSKQLEDKFATIRYECSQMRQSLQQVQDSQAELKQLREENASLLSVNATVDERFNKYQEIVNRLQAEIDNFKASEKHNEASELKHELLESHRDFNALQEEYNELNEAFVKFQEAAAEKERALQNKITGQEGSKSDKMLLERLQQDLNVAVEKQRILKAEKIRLTYKAESLVKDKAALQNTIQNLTEKINSGSGESSRSDDSTVKRLNILEYQLGELLSLDISNFQKLLKSFNKIADDTSLKEPTRKIEYLIKQVSQDNNLDTAEFKSIKDYHKSVFSYFVRAVDVIVNDHVKLLLRENEEAVQTREYVSKLHERIDELNSINDMAYETTLESPKSRMRIDELTNRWKAEREARVYESGEARRRLRQLEDENARLREKLNE